MSSSELAKNPCVIGLAGEEGAEKLARIADKDSDKPYLWSFESVDENKTRVSSLDSGCLDLRLYYLGGSGYGRAFGVLEKTG